MGPFVLTSALSVWSAALLVQWLGGASLRAWFGGRVLASLSVILHPLSVVTLSLLIVPAYLVRMRHLAWRVHMAAWSVPLLGAVVWSPWWFPAWVLRDTYGTSAIGFVNENVRGRMDELLRA